MMTDVTIVEFLTARIAADERAARRWQIKDGAMIQWRTRDDFDEGREYEVTDYAAAPSGAAGSARPRVMSEAEFWAEYGVESFDERARRECEAKREIVEWHGEILEHLEGGAHDRPCRTLRALAAVYAGHPDYRPEWTL